MASKKFTDYANTPTVAGGDAILWQNAAGNNSIYQTFTQLQTQITGVLPWSRDAVNGYVFPSTITDKVGIGTNAPTAKLHILPSSSVTAIETKLPATTPGYAYVLRNSSNASMIRFLNTGSIELLATSVSNPNFSLQNFLGHKWHFGVFTSSDKFTFSRSGVKDYFSIDNAAGIIEFNESVVISNFGASDVGQIIKLTAGQTANAFEVQDSSTVIANIDKDGYVSGKKSGVFAYLTASTNTTVTTADTYYPIAGSFTNSPMEDFSFDTDHLEYDGNKTQYFEIDWHASISGDANGITCDIGVKINTTVVTSSVMGTYLKTSGEVQALSGTCVVELETDDEIQLVLTSDSDGDVITVEHFTTTISEFFD